MLKRFIGKESSLFEKAKADLNFRFDEELERNIPVNVNVSVAIQDVIKIVEIDHVYTLKVLKWIGVSF